jgi:hypothetical protein
MAPSYEEQISKARKGVPGAYWTLRWLPFDGDNGDDLALADVGSANEPSKKRINCFVKAITALAAAPADSSSHLLPFLWELYSMSGVSK